MKPARAGFGVLKTDVRDSPLSCPLLKGTKYVGRGHLQMGDMTDEIRFRVNTSHFLIA